MSVPSAWASSLGVRCDAEELPRRCSNGRLFAEVLVAVGKLPAAELELFGSDNSPVTKVPPPLLRSFGRWPELVTVTC